MDTSSPSHKIYQRGSLTYTSRHLMVLFFWLLWGDFCYVLMEAVVPSIMPVRFREMGVSNTEMGLVGGTIPGIIYTILNPVISFKSDRYRGKRGRRIPFILFSLPFLVLALVGLGYAKEVGYWLYQELGLLGVQLTVPGALLLTTGVMLAAFTVFNTFVTSTFWYLFNDVVPEELLARFMSWFRMISLVAGALYHFCIFRFAGTHSTEIFVGASMLYLVGFSLMCLNVKEGAYPPAPALVGGQTGPFAAIKTYGKECLTIKHYWYQWIGAFLGALSGGVNAFVLLFLLAIGLNYSQIGIIHGSGNLTVAVLVLGAGWLADRYHPLRVVIAGNIFGLFIAVPATLIWLFWHPAPQVAFWVALAIALGLTAPATALNAMADPPLLMRIFPRERYGQFCSANGMWRSLGGIAGGGLAGCYLDFIARYVGKERSYFFIPVWTLFFAVPSLLCLIGLYRSWKRYGGDEAYVPPIAGSGEALETKDAAPAEPSRAH